MEYYSSIKKNEILSFAATQIDLEGIMLSKREKDKYDIICMLTLKNTKTNEYNRLTDLVNKLVVTSRAGGEL